MELHMCGKERDNIQCVLAELLEQLPRPECRTCDCFQGFITQVELDAETDISAMTNPLKVESAKMHACLGCDPCPPAEAFARYLKKK